MSSCPGLYACSHFVQCGGLGELQSDAEDGNRYHGSAPVL